MCRKPNHLWVALGGGALMAIGLLAAGMPLRIAPLASIVSAGLILYFEPARIYLRLLSAVVVGWIGLSAFGAIEISLGDFSVKLGSGNPGWAFHLAVALAVRMLLGADGKLSENRPVAPLDNRTP